MKLKRLGETQEDRLIEEAATKALVTGEKIVDLSTLKAAKGLDIRQAALAFQKRGYGQLLEISGNGEREYLFSLRDGGYSIAAEIRKAMHARSLRGRIQNLNWTAVNALAAWVAALAALAAAYYSYLSFVSQHAPSH